MSCWQARCIHSWGTNPLIIYPTPITKTAQTWRRSEEQSVYLLASIELFFFKLLDLEVGNIPLTALVGDKAPFVSAWAPTTMSPAGEWGAGSALMAGRSRRGSLGIIRMSCFVMWRRGTEIWNTFMLTDTSRTSQEVLCMLVVAGLIFKYSGFAKVWTSITVGGFERKSTKGKQFVSRGFCELHT